MKKVTQLFVFYFILSLVFMLNLVGCGQKGDLYLPKPNQEQDSNEND